MRKVVVYVEGKSRNPFSREETPRDYVIDEILQKISDKYNPSAELLCIYHHYPFYGTQHEFSDRCRHRRKDDLFVLDFGNCHPESLYDGNGHRIEDCVVNYINDDLEPSLWSRAIEIVTDAEIFIAVNPGAFSAPYRAILQNLPSNCECFWIGDNPQIEDLYLEKFDFGSCLDI